MKIKISWKFSRKIDWEWKYSERLVSKSKDYIENILTRENIRHSHSKKVILYLRFFFYFSFHERFKKTIVTDCRHYILSSYNGKNSPNIHSEYPLRMTSNALFLSLPLFLFPFFPSSLSAFSTIGWFATWI